jgi:DNA-binding transcriptional MerR regulator
MVQGLLSSSRYIAQLPHLKPAPSACSPAMVSHLPAIPAKRYFTIGEVADLCDVKPHVLRYWEQEFAQLKPMKRRGNRRYYQHHEVLMVRRIRELLYEQGFTISGARNRLREQALPGKGGAELSVAAAAQLAGSMSGEARVQEHLLTEMLAVEPSRQVPALGADEVKEELLQIRALLSL